MFDMYIETNAPAFQYQGEKDDMAERTEIAHILEGIAREIKQSGGTGGMCFDSNANLVGHWRRE